MPPPYRPQGMPPPFYTLWSCPHGARGARERRKHRPLPVRAVHALRGRHRTSRSRDSQAASARNKLHPVGQRAELLEPISCSWCLRRKMITSCHCSAPASTRHAHRCEYVKHDDSCMGARLGGRVHCSSMQGVHSMQRERSAAPCQTWPRVCVAPATAVAAEGPAAAHQVHRF